MSRKTITAFSIFALVAALAGAEEKITVTRNGTRPASRGAAPSFTASVRIDPLFDAVDWMEPVSDEQYNGPVAAAAGAPSPAETHEDLLSVAPALEQYTQRTLLAGVWKRPGLSPRDRSIVTVASLIARGQAIELPHYLNVALDEAAERLRATRVAEDYSQVAPGVVQYTTDVLFRDLWLRPALAPRDRSLVTVSALVTTGQGAQVAFHLNRAMDNGLTKLEASEMLVQLAFYAGWPNVFSALPVVKGVLEKRP